MHPGTRTRRRVAPAGSPGPDGDESAEKLDYMLISSSICNGDDLGPLVRKAFAAGKPDALLHHLRRFARSKEAEIEDVCRSHYEDFILAVDDLRALLADADSLKSALSETNCRLQEAGLPLLARLEELLEAETVRANLCLALRSATLCARTASVCANVNGHLSSDDLYLALKSLSLLEQDLLPRTPSSALRRMLDCHIPTIRAHIELRVSKDFSDWLVQIRVASRELGQLAIGRASSARQREEELRVKQRQVEEQTKVSLRDCVYSLHTEEDDDMEEDRRSDTSAGSNSAAGGDIADLRSLYRCYHIYQTLGLKDRFRQQYLENRKLQLTSDFQISSMSPFLESHQTFFAQIAGFFIVEDRIFRTAGDLIFRNDVDNLWDMAIGKMCSVLEDQFSRMQTANHLLLIKDYVSLLGVTLRRYGYHVDPLLVVLSQHRDKYHELLLADCQKQMSDAISGDKFDPMVMKKEYEYNMNVLAFHIQNSDIIPAFPYIAPFSSTVPDCCRIVRSFVEDSVSFLSYSGQLDFYDVVKKYLDRLLAEVLNGSLLRLMSSGSVYTVSQAMQVAANTAILERACEFFVRHAAQLSGIPIRTVERKRRPVSPLTPSIEAAHDLLLRLVKTKVDEFMTLLDNVNWIADDPPYSGNEYVNEVVIYLETLVSTGQQILSPDILMNILRGVLRHVSDSIVAVLAGDGVKRFNATAVTGLDADLKILESFAETQDRQLMRGGEEVEENGADSSVQSTSPSSSGPSLKESLMEARQLVNLLDSSHPENFLNPVIREKHYGALDYRKVVTISEKLRDPSERYFSTFGTRAAKQNPKKKSLDALIKRLKEV
ncbi:Exocyst complex component [Nymphaea thermarum]|nr:Exocyst complex component [Nymphaea thermarum]